MMNERSDKDEQSEILIGAYLDGEMPEHERSAFEQAMEKDGALRARLELRKLEFDQLKSALRQIDTQEMPQGVLGMLKGDDNLVAFPTKRTSPVLPLAASLAFVGILTLFVFNSVRPGASAFALETALDTALSGERVTLSSDKNGELLVNFSFVDGQGRFCREYLFIDTDQTLQRVACKGEHSWQTQIEAKVTPESSSAYRPVSSSLSIEVDAYLDQHMASEILTEQVELEAISQKWQSKKQD